MTPRQSSIQVDAPNTSDLTIWLRQRAFEAAGSGMVITDATRPDHPIIDVNPAFERITGHRREDVLGQNCRMLQSHRTDRATIAEIRSAIAARREVNVTLLNQRRDGSSFWNELRIAPLFNDAGALTHFVGIQTDVTARKLAEARTRFLAQASDQLGLSLDYRSALVSTATLAVPLIGDIFLVHLLDRQGRIGRVAAQFADLPPGVRDAVLAAWSGEAGDDHGAARAIRTGLSGFVPSVGDGGPPSLTRDDRSFRRVTGARLRSTLSVPLIARRRILGALTLATTSQSDRDLDTLDLVLMEDLARRAALAIDNAQLFAEAQAAVRARDQFLSIAAHELRTPVSSIKGYAQMLLRAQRKGTITPERIRRSLETIDNSTDRLTLLTSDLLDVSRIRLGHLPLRPAEIDLAAKVRSVVARYLESAGGAHRIDVAIPPGAYRVVADSDRIDQVLTNLFENAAKYSPGRDRIEVTLRRSDDELRLEVRDEGIGLPPGGETGIFAPFERAANAVEHNLPGLGLGLYICRGILERHGGRIWAESDGEGRGTAFIVTLPTAGNGPDLTT
ncbi:MAG: diguanylate cyclase/phosphodiesterase (GGDEF & EAL domains) with PAS/PAC sensor(s) [uncultured Thermomicrobiales bacterium]|uniref:histidine kinase n=1 Tax=uncultured Thermomicrobiales bacterium TaxID=1645740 RepID=A0A6J4VKH1_9BACT|nr:MAG: diguanylate cyclase/phosphodiesterase (GGDEF & EAL domains) with PAS/PAC sensor(s) [uncultured Thermomicrobiales bacterium]